MVAIASMVEGREGGYAGVQEPCRLPISGVLSFRERSEHACEREWKNQWPDLRACRETDIAT